MALAVNEKKIDEDRGIENRMEQDKDEEGQPPRAADPGSNEDDERDAGPLDLDSRVLCPDGNCVGIVGPDGRCKICGETMDPEDAPPPPRKTDREDPRMEAAPEIACAEEEESPDLDQRLLCSDGACIGVIGTNGYCKVCGKPHADDSL
jgi:hypothetical protein